MSHITCPVCGDSKYVKAYDEKGMPFDKKETCDLCLHNEGRPWRITMMYKTSSKNELAVHTDYINSNDPVKVTEFLKKNCVTAGFSVQYAYNPETKHIIEIFKKGRVGSRVVKKLIEYGYTEYLYSWAFATKTFKLSDGTTVVIDKKNLLDLTTMEDIRPWARAFGYEG